MSDYHENVQGSSVSPAVIGWGVASAAFTIFAIVVNTAPSVVGASFVAKCFAALAGTVLGVGGALLGDAIRRFAHPDAVLTNGGIMQLLWIKVFWAVGPQIIGLVVGSALGIGLVC